MEKNHPSFKFGLLFLLSFPYAVVRFFSDKREMVLPILASALIITIIATSLYFYKNRREILSGVVAAAISIVIFSILAMIPAVGWIFDILLLISIMASIIESIKTLAPLAAKSAMIWAVYVITLLPVFHNSTFNILGYLFFCIVLTAALSKKSSPYEELILVIASIPLLAIVIASLGKMFQSSIKMTSVKVPQSVSGYTTEAGVKVSAYTRNITKSLPETVIKINPSSAIVNRSSSSLVKREES